MMITVYMSVAWLKFIHTCIWGLVTAANLFAFYFAFIGRFDIWFWIPASILAAEIGIIISYDWKCPLTGLIEARTKDRRPNFGIYLPGWMAKYNIRIYSVLLPLEALAVIVKHLF